MPTYFPVIPACSPSFCGAFRYLNGTELTYQRGDFLIGDRAMGVCIGDYVPVGGNGSDMEIVCGPVVDAPGKPNVVWQRSGTRAGPLCIERGKVLSTKVYLEGVMEARLTLGLLTLDSLACGNTSFEIKTSLAIAAGLCAASAAVPISAFSVDIVNNTACNRFSGRLLADNPTFDSDTAEEDASATDPTARRTSSAPSPMWVGLGFKAYVETLEQAEIVLRQMSFEIQNEVYRRAFKETYQEENRMPVQDIEVTKLSLRVKYSSGYPTTTTTVTTTTTTTRMVRLSSAHGHQGVRAFLLWLLVFSLPMRRIR